ncbi:hypothetical protein M3J09_013768 [Ascochyta lentis]
MPSRITYRDLAPIPNGVVMSTYLRTCIVSLEDDNVMFNAHGCFY